MQELKPPPEALTQWIQLIAVQLVAVGGLLIGIWKWLTKPLRSDVEVLKKRVSRLYREFRKDSFEIRTEATNIMGRTITNEAQLKHIDESLDHLQECVDENHKEMSTTLRSIKDRLAAVEADLKAREKYERRDPDG